MIDEGEVRGFFSRLSHHSYGVTEITVIGSSGIAATGFFDNEEDFVSACREYVSRGNVYAGRNPRPVSGRSNGMDSVRKIRANDAQVFFLTGFSLDIDVVRRVGEAATFEQRQAARMFALNVDWDNADIAWIDDSGNGVYLWWQFINPIALTAKNRERVKRQCQLFTDAIRRKYLPERYGLRIDSCFEFSRIKRVIGTYNHKAQRLSRNIRAGRASDRVRDEILSLKVEEQSVKPKESFRLPVSGSLPETFRNELLRHDPVIKKLWTVPDPSGDSSRHDWRLGVRCLELGITDPEELGIIIANNPLGKFRRDRRSNYVERTVKKLLHSYGCFIR